MSSLSKLLHVGWTLKGPDLLNLARTRKPTTFRPSASWYHDYPTAIIACLSLLEDPGLGRMSKLADRYSIIGIGAGVAWHCLSVCVLARRTPRYERPLHSRSEIVRLIGSAASEEVIWHKDGGFWETLLASVGFGCTHLKIGSVAGSIHMATFCLVSRWLESRHGLMTSVLFHSAYNFAHDCDLGRRTP